jgi:hypothetical protein
MRSRKSLLSIGLLSANDTAGRDKSGATVRPISYQWNVYYCTFSGGRGGVGGGDFFLRFILQWPVLFNFFVCDKFFFFFFSWLEGGVSGSQVRRLGMQLVRSL